MARSGRPGPVVIDLPKDVLINKGTYVEPAKVAHKSYNPRLKADPAKIAEVVELMAQAKRPVFYMRRRRHQLRGRARPSC